MKNKVVLFHPPYDGPPLGPPLSLLSLASPLLEAGFQVSIVDASIDPEYKSSLASEITGALCLGISLLTGRMIRSAVDVSRFVREIQPRPSDYLWRLAPELAAGANACAKILWMRSFAGKGN